MSETPERAGIPDGDKILALRGDVETLTAQAVAVGDAILLLRADLRAAEERSAAELAEAEKRTAANLKAEKGKRRRGQRWILAVITFDLAVTIAVATVLSGQASTNAHLKTATAQIQESLRQNYATTQQQAQVRTQVLCPLYGVLIAFADDPARTVGLTPAEKLRSDKAVAVVQAGYKALGCEPVLTAARVPAG